MPGAASYDESGKAPSQGTSPSPVGSGGTIPGMSHAFAGLRRVVRMALRHLFVAIRYSQVRIEACSLKASSPCHAESSVSCSASSASWTDPSIR